MRVSSGGNGGEKARRKDSTGNGRPSPGHCRRERAGLGLGGGEGGARARAAPVPPAEPGQAAAARGPPGAPCVRRPPELRPACLEATKSRNALKKKCINNNHKIVITRRKEQAPSQQAGSRIGSGGKESSESRDNANIQIGYSTIKPGALIAILRAPWKLRNMKSA